MRSPVAGQFVRHQPGGLSSLSFQQLTKEAFGSTPIPTSLHEDVNHVPVLIDGTSEIVSLPLDGHEGFVQVPPVAQTTLSSLQYVSVFGADLPAPLANGLVSDGDSALGEKVFDVSKAQTEAVIEPNSVTDNFCGKAMASIAERAAVHSPSLPITTPT